jgi:hypothetical protein
MLVGWSLTIRGLSALCVVIYEYQCRHNSCQGIQFRDFGH